MSSGAASEPRRERSRRAADSTGHNWQDDPAAQGYGAAMRTVRLLLWVSLANAGGCSSPQPNTPPPPAPAAAMTASQTAASAAPTATAQATASEPACPARRLI